MIRKHKTYYVFKNEKGERYYGVNSIIKTFKPEVNWDEIAEKTAKKRGVDPEELKAQWKLAGELSIKRGKLYHAEMENKYKAMKRANIYLPDPKQLVWEEQSLEKDSVYIEKLVWSDEHKVMGFVDYMQTVGNVVNMIDYKTSKEIKEDNPWQSYNEPLLHLSDCNLVDYSLQLNMYMNIVLKANPKFKMGKMIIEHVKFDEKDNVVGTNKIEIQDYQKEIEEIWKFGKT